MILQALTQYYAALQAQGEVAAPGWGPVKVAYALCLSENGELERVISVQTEQKSEKKTKLIPQTMSLPAQVKRTVDVKANFLCDHSGYLLGIDGKGNAARTKACFAACKTLHEKILAGVDTPAAKVLLAFFRAWDPDSVAAHPALAEQLADVLAGGNLVFRYDGAYVHEDPAVRRAWDQHYAAAKEDGSVEQVCLVTGEYGPVERIHLPIKGVRDAQSSGAALVSFNAPAFCSYGKEQNLNAPTGKYAAFAYTTALNYLIARRPYYIGDATVVFWAKSGQEAYQNAFAGLMRQSQNASSESSLRRVLEELCRGHSSDFEETTLDPNMEFYILGLSPNAARLSVRFFLRNTFGNFLKNLNEHRQRLSIVRPAYEPFEVPSLRALLDSTVNQNSRNKDASPEMAGETLRAILNDTPYPATLLNGAALRIRAEHTIPWERAALIKAYYLKNTNPEVPKEVLTVALNEESQNIPYCLGRLFSVLEAIQQSANPGINSTIKDKYFNSASATPATVFPILINLAQKHLKKLGGGQSVYYDKQLQAVMDRLPEEFPTRLSLPQQGAFQLGYYHQTQARYTKKED